MLRFWPLLSALYYRFGFVFPDTGTYSSYLLAHVWGWRKIRSRCDTTSWFTGSLIDRELPTNANGRAFATRCTTKRHYTTRFGISGGGTQKYVYCSCICCVHVRMYLNVGFDATASTKRIHDALVSRGSSYFLGPLICIVSSVKHGFLANVCTLEYLHSQNAYVNEQSQQSVYNSSTDRLA